MPGVSIHVVDVSRGVVATGMRVELCAWENGQERPIAEGVIGANGLLAHAALEQRFERGSYFARFRVAAYYRGVGAQLPAVPFLDVVRYDFGIDSPDAHYHLPFKCTPWGYSCFRGGA
jgi:5-hydroxyisourate hydrolase